MMVDSSRKAAIVGIGQTEFSKNSGRSEQQLAAEAILAACLDAGISPHEIDGMTTFSLDHSDEVDVMRSLGCREINYTTRLPQGGAASVATIVHAKNAVESGLCDVFVIWRAMNERSQYRFGQPAMSIPVGTVQAPGGPLPVGLQIVATHHREDLVLRVARFILDLLRS